MTNRNWPEFWDNAKRSLRAALVATALVPTFFFLLDNQYGRPEYWLDFLNSTRIGLEARLSKRDFFRCHRNCIVNLSKIRQIAAGPFGTLKLVGAGSVPVSRSRRRVLVKLLHEQKIII